MKRALVAAALLALLGGAASAFDEPSSSPQSAGDIQAQAWINSDGRKSLADFRGEVVLVDIWSTD
jgi:hypothetical protein